MAIRNFGPSTLWATREDIAGGTPIKFGSVQSFTIDHKATTKELQGQGVFADAIGRSKISVTGKIAYGAVHAAVFSDLFFGTSLSTGQLTTANAEGAVVPAVAPYTYAVANAATFFSDKGVSYAATGVPMQQVPAAPTVGQYMVNSANGTYTFAAADEGQAILVSYLYSIAGTGQQISIMQTPQGIQPVFEIVNERLYQGQTGIEKCVYRLPCCVADDLSSPTKQGDFSITDLGWAAFAGPNGLVEQISFNRVT
jgi:hypothetical protein